MSQPRYVLLSEFDFGASDVSRFADEVRRSNRDLQREAIELGGIEVTNMDDCKRELLSDSSAQRKKRISRNGLEFEIIPADPETPDQRLRRMLAEDVRADLQHVPTVINQTPPKRPLLIALIYAWTFLRVLRRELYGPAHLRRYL